MRTSIFPFLFSTVLLCFGIKNINCEGSSVEHSHIHEEAAERFAQNKVTSESTGMPAAFEFFSNKFPNVRPQINLFLEENTNFGLRRTIKNDRNRYMRKQFADFQELRQNDILRFQELMAVQNEQLKLLKDIIFLIKK